MNPVLFRGSNTNRQRNVRTLADNKIRICGTIRRAELLSDRFSIHAEQYRIGVHAIMMRVANAAFFHDGLVGFVAVYHESIFRIFATWFDVPDGVCFLMHFFLALPMNQN